MKHGDYKGACDGRNAGAKVKSKSDGKKVPTGWAESEGAGKGSTFNIVLDSTFEPPEIAGNDSR